MRLTPLAKALIGVAVVGGGIGAYKVWFSGPPAPTCKGLLGRPLRVGVVTWPGYAGGIVANNGFKPNKDCIYFQKKGLCVEFMLMEDMDKRSAAFAKGGPEGVDIVWSTVDTTASEFPGFIKSGVQARSIMQVDWSRGGDAIVADNSIKRIEDLAGKKVSVTTSSPSQWLLEWNLQNSSLDENQQDAINKNLVGKNASPDARADFVANRVPAAVVWEPDVTAALQNRPNSHILVSSKEARKLIADVMIARADFVKEHPDVIEAFIEGWIVDGTEKANADPDTVVRLLMENEPVYKDLGAPETKNNLSGVHWATLADNAEMFNLDGKDPQGVEPLYDRIFVAAAKTWQKLGTVTTTIPPAASKDDSIVRKIYNRTPVARIPDEFKPADRGKVTEAPRTTAQITVNFALGVATLDAAARSVIDEKVSLIPTTFSGAYIRVEGNTDNTGTAAVNGPLSERRAQAVVDYLVTKYKLPHEQFIALGNGWNKPVEGVDPNSVEGRAKNRRTDIGIVPK